MATVKNTQSKVVNIKTKDTGKKAKGLLALDDPKKIAELSARIVYEALDPQRLCDYILNYCDDEARGTMDALRTAIDPRYQDFQERYDRGERGDVETELKIVIEEQVKFHVGVAVGRRVSNG